MTCRELIEFLMDYLAGELPPSQHAALDRHLAICPACVTYLKSYQDTVRLGKAAFQIESESAPPVVPEALIRAVLAARQGGGPAQPS